MYKRPRGVCGCLCEPTSPLPCGKCHQRWDAGLVGCGRDRALQCCELPLCAVCVTCVLCATSCGYALCVLLCYAVCSAEWLDLSVCECHQRFLLDCEQEAP